MQFISQIQHALVRSGFQLSIFKAIKKMMKYEERYGLSLLNPGDLLGFEDICQESHFLESSSFVQRNNQGNSPNSNQFYSEKHIVTLRNVLVDSFSGIVFTENGKIPILESSNILPGEVSYSLKPMRPKSIHAGTWTVLSSRSYAHWLMQDLPRFLNVLENAPDINVAISPSAPRFVTDALQILKVTNVKEVRVLRPEKLVFVTSQYATGLPSQSDLEKIRNLGKFVRVNSTQAIESHPKKIYISRRNSRRSIKDEIKVEESAKKWGFTVVFLEDFNLGDEIGLFSQVEEVIGPMGAGFFNLIWANSSKVKRVVEISDPSQINDTFQILAEDLGIPFKRVFHNIDFIDDIFIN